jgi:glycosyltransferase involved in cell wall biosynthesis
MVKRKKILMFGWEFPPEISGGLGVATLGLCKALAHDADVKMIIPKNVPNFNIENIELVGLNSIDPEDIEVLFGTEPTPKIPILPSSFKQPIGPYSSVLPSEFLDQTYYEYYNAAIQPFEIEELYGGDVIAKVIEFEKIAVAYCLKDDFDIIHAHDWLTFLPAMHLKMITGKPLVIHIHSTEFDRTGVESNNWVFELERRAMEMADCIIPVSNYTGDICVQYYGADPHKIRTVHNGIVPVSTKVDAKKRKGNLVVYFGRVTQQKGPDYFVEAAKKVLEYLPDTKFVMAGAGDLLETMILKTASYGIGDRFYFTNFLNKDKLDELLFAADLYCMPSKSEPFGLSALEAAQFGIPVIISNTSGVAEVLPGAMKVAFDDVDKLAAYMVASLNFTGLRQAVVAADNSSLSQITWEKCAKEVMQVYESLFNETNNIC